MISREVKGYKWVGTHIQGDPVRVLYEASESQQQNLQESCNKGLHFAERERRL